MKYGILEFPNPVPDISRKIIHIDMDAFYASIEMRDHPEIAHKSVVIAKHPNLTGGRGIVSTCNYQARSYGIHSAMSAAEAYKRCPHAVFMPGDHDKYKRISQQIRQIFLLYTDMVQTVALDEAYLDVTENTMTCPSATIIGQRIQAEIYHKVKLTASVGVSYNKFLAKIASDFNKPHGLTVVEPQDAHDFLMNLPIEKFHGVGIKSREMFQTMGIKTGRDLYQLSLDDLIQDFGKMGLSLYYKVRGQSSNIVESHRVRKSISKERTFSVFLEADEAIQAVLLELCQKVSQTLKKCDLSATTVTLKVRYDNFETFTRQASTQEAIQNSNQIFDNVLDLWQKFNNKDRPVRLLGVSLSNFVYSEYSKILLEI